MLYLPLLLIIEWFMYNVSFLSLYMCSNACMAVPLYSLETLAYKFNIPHLFSPSYLLFYFMENY